MKYYEDKSDRKMELKLLSLSEDDKLIRECMEQASAFYGCLGKMGVLILILGYVPPFKKRFARSIKKRPSIENSYPDL